MTSLSGATALGGAAAPDSVGETGRVGAPAYVVLILAGVVLNIFSGQSALLGVPISPDRICFAAGLGLLVLDRSAWAGLRLRLRPVHALIAATLALTVWSAASHGSLLDSYGLYALLDRMALPYLFFVLAPVIFRTPQQRDLLLKVLTVLGLYLGVTAFLEIAGPTSLVFPRYIMDPSVGIQFGRARGPFLGSEADGLVMLACGFAAAYGVARWRGLWRLVAVLTVVACALGALLTLTRSIWVGGVLGAVLAFGLDRRLRRALPVLGAVLVVAVLVALAVVPGLRESVTARAGTQRSVYDRQNTNAAALRVIEQHPLDGLGWVQFLDQGELYVRQDPTYPITNVHIEVHNVALGRMAELGLPGGLLWVGTVLAGPAYLALRRRRPAVPGAQPEDDDAHGWRLVLVGVLVSWGVAANLSPLPYPLPNLLVWLVAGVASGSYLVERVPARAAR